MALLFKFFQCPTVVTIGDDNVKFAGPRVLDQVFIEIFVAFAADKRRQEQANEKNFPHQFAHLFRWPDFPSQNFSRTARFTFLEYGRICGNEPTD